MARIADYGIVKQIGVQTVVLNIVIIQPKIRFLVVVAICYLQATSAPRNIRIYIPKLSRNIKPLGFYFTSPSVGGSTVFIWVKERLACLFFIIQIPKIEKTNITVFGIGVLPTVHHIYLLHQGCIEKRIIIFIKLCFPQISVNIQPRAPTVSNFCVEMCIQLKTAIPCAISVNKKFIVCGRFLQFGIYLPCNAFITICNTTCAFGYLDAFHPGSRNKTQSISLRSPANAWNVFSGYQNIRTGKPKHFNLSRSRNGIGKVHINGRICFKTFRQITASSLQKFGAAYVQNICSLNERT